MTDKERVQIIAAFEKGSSTGRTIETTLFTALFISRMLGRDLEEVLEIMRMSAQDVRDVYCARWDQRGNPRAAYPTVHRVNAEIVEE